MSQYVAFIYNFSPALHVVINHKHNLRLRCTDIRNDRAYLTKWKFDSALYKIIKTNYLHQCIVLKSFYTLKPSTHIKIDFKSYFNMFRSRWTIIREHVVPIPKDGCHPQDNMQNIQQHYFWNTDFETYSNGRKENCINITNYYCIWHYCISTQQ